MSKDAASFLLVGESSEAIGSVGLMCGDVQWERLEIGKGPEPRMYLMKMPKRSFRDGGVKFRCVCVQGG